MVFNIFRKVTMFGRCPLPNKTLKRFYSLYEPDYLKEAESKIPLYPTLNIQIKGYVYPLLESYQALIHKVTDAMDIEVDDGWPLPPQELKVQRFKKNTTAIDSEYELKIYERNIQISDLPSTKCSILLRLLEATLPEGVSLKVDVYDPAVEEKCFVPDKQLLDLKSELDTIKRK